MIKINPDKVLYNQNLVGGFITELVGVKILHKEMAIASWKKTGYGYKGRLNDFDFRLLIKMDINGELKK